MDFKDEIKQLGERVTKMLPQIKTEEATKNALIMPFIKLLGYDVFDPFEVNPEFIADLGIKKGEKVDYAIMNDGKPIILIECKHHLEKLDPHNSQLFRYFHVTPAKFGILTNGLCYRFYTDLVEPNKMDESPFMEFNLTEIKENEVNELKKFHKSYFNVETIVNTASELKYSTSIRNILSNEVKNPTPDFVRFFVKRVYDGLGTEKVITQFTEIVKKSINQFISDLISERLKSALDKESASEEPVSTIVKDVSVEKPIETTDLEKEGFFIVKSILRQKIDGSRIIGRDTQTYFGVLLDDNNRKPLCRLWLNGGKKYVGVFDENKKETRLEITTLDDIYKYSEQISKCAEYYK